jgi:polyphosphate kinase
VFLRRWDELSHEQQGDANQYFDREISPALTPLVFDPAHPFPFLSNLSTSPAFMLHGRQKEAVMYARVKVPTVLKQWVALNAGLSPGSACLSNSARSFAAMLTSCIAGCSSLARPCFA